jgi:hypothetical protein
MRARPGLDPSVFFAAMLGAAMMPSVARDAVAAPSPAAAKQKACLVAAEQGQQLRNAGHLLEAREQFLACQVAACPAIVREDCIKWLGEIVDATPTVVISVRDATGADVFDAKILVDGAPLASDLLGRPFPLNPGKHTVVASRGELTKEIQVLVAQGSKQRSVEVVLSEPVVVAPPSKIEPPLPFPPPPVVKVLPLPPPPPPPFFGPQRYASLGVAGLGLVGLVTGAAIGAGYNSSIADLREGCGRTSSCAQSDVDALGGKRTTAYVLTGLGSVLVVTGAVLFATGRPRPRTPERAMLTPSIAPVRGGAFAALEGSF